MLFILLLTKLGICNVLLVVRSQFKFDIIPTTAHYEEVCIGQNLKIRIKT